MAHRKLANALLGKCDSTASYVSLCGEWRVKFIKNESEISSKEYDPKSDIKSWGSATVQLPSSWQIAGYGNLVYTDKAYPFLENAPQKGKYPTPAQSNCALYARDFTVPFDYADKKVYLTIGAATSKATLFINGQKIGFATDSKNPARYDISDFIERGRNRVMIFVEDFDKSSWVENISGWNLNGINRDIYIYAQPKIRMRDVLVSTSLDPTYSNGLLETALLLKSELLNPHTVTVYYDLYDTKGTIIRKEKKEITIDMQKEDTVRFHSSVPSVEKWNSETPNLYTIVYSVQREGRYTEYVAVKVGFRSVEIKNGSLLINGVAPIIKGVNFEEVNPATGNVNSKEEVQRELEQMRLSGFNAIRTNGYPMPQYFYDLTDSIGFYVFNIANTNTQGLDNSLSKGSSLANNPAWRDVFVDRAVTAYERTKRNSSVIAVGLGQSAGNGYNMYEAYNAIKARNKNCIVVYDGAGAEWNTDIATPLYPTTEDLTKLTKRGVIQPIIAAKVKFDEKYWKLENTQGAFIDSWNNCSIRNTAVKAYSQLDNNYKLSKLPNGTDKRSSAKAEIAQIKPIFANITIESLDNSKGVIKINNHLQYTNLNSYTLRYRVINNGKLGKWVELNVECAPQQSVEVTLSGFGDKKELEIEIGNIFSSVLK